MKRSLPFLSLVLLVSLLSTPALSKKPDFQGGKGNAHKGGQQVEHGSDALAQDSIASLVFGDEKRAKIRSHLRETHRGSCPPGLAKKNNGCLPPGQAKKYWIGGNLPSGYGKPSGELLALLGPAPRGAYYATVDKDVLLVSEATKKILDAVTLMSAME